MLLDEGRMAHQMSSERRSHYRNDNVDQNFDTYSMEYTFQDGSKLFVNGRTIPGCKTEFASYAHGTKALPSFPHPASRC